MTEEVATPSSLHPSPSDWGYLLALCGIWGTAFLFIDIAVETLPPATLVASRVAIAAGVLWAAVRVAGLSLPPAGRIWFRLLILACVALAQP